MGFLNIRDEKEGENTEDVNERVIALSVNAGKVSAREFVQAIQLFLERETQHVPHGKVPLKELVKGGQTVNDIEIPQSTLKSFEKIAKKYKIDYAVKQVNYTDPPKTLIFFKGNNVDVMEQCFKEFLHKEKEMLKEPISEKVEKAKEQCKQINKEKEKHKELVR